jgi:cytochrome b561
MNEILELQTGQVSFISGLMAGFSLSVAVQIIRSKDKSNLAIATFILFTVTSLLFLIALYIDVALSLRIAGVSEFSPDLLERIAYVRTIGTSAATSALFLFIVSIGIIGWLQSRLSGVVTSIFALITIATVWVARSMIFGIVG